MIRFHEHDGKLYRHESEVAGHAAVWHRDGWRWVEHVPPQAKSLSARTVSDRTGGCHDDPVSSFADIADPLPVVVVMSQKPGTVTLKIGDAGTTTTTRSDFSATSTWVYADESVPSTPTAKPAKKKAAKKRAKKKAARKKRRGK